MNFRKVILLSASVALAPISGWSLEVGPPTVPEEAANAPNVTVPAAAPLSSVTQDVMKMVSVGLSDDVIQAYISNSPAQFNLTADNIIDLQKRGVSAGLLTAMITHDKNLQASMQAQAEAQAANSVPSTTTTAPSTTQQTVNPPAVVSDDAIYDNLYPYGSWTYMGGYYGWGWQPYGWVSYGAYPWGWLGFGSWSCLPNHGWCWFPHSCFNSFHNFNHFNNFHANAAFRAHGFNNQFHGNGFNNFHGNGFNNFHGNGFNQFHGNTAFAANRAAINHAAINSTVVHPSTINSSAVRSSAFRSSGAFQMNHVAASGFHGSAGGTHFSGGGGGSAFHGGGFHGGGGGGGHGGGGGGHR